MKDASLISETSTAHTPGPWETELHESADVRSSDGGLVAQMSYLRGRYGVRGRKTSEEVRANARLIAAAPDLLAALDVIATEADSMGWAQIRHIARKAIDKAKGRV